MALTMNYQRVVEGMELPVLIPNAYWRILDLQGSKEELLVKVEVKERKEAQGAIGLLSFSFSPDPNGTNYHEQAYQHLKTLDTFRAAIDC